MTSTVSKQLKVQVLSNLVVRRLKSCQLPARLSLDHSVIEYAYSRGLNSTSYGLNLKEVDYCSTGFNRNRGRTGSSPLQFRS